MYDKKRFSKFAKKLGSVLKGNTSAQDFTRQLFEAIIPKEKYEILEGLTDESYRKYFSGDNGISGIAKDISTIADKQLFEMYIDKYDDATIGRLCEAFKDDFPDIDEKNASEILADQFSKIISEAAKRTYKKHSTKDGDVENSDVLRDVAPNSDNVIDKVNLTTSFCKYLESATDFYSTKKTLLYAEKPHPFYDMYVCNNISGTECVYVDDDQPGYLAEISNATTSKIKAESEYAIIQGTGGIGKTMLMTHLFLDSAKNVDSKGKIPVLIPLKNCKDTNITIIDFIYKSVSDYDLMIDKSIITTALEQKLFVLLLDGLDEIHSSVKTEFDQSLERFIKSYPGNQIVMTSRPKQELISYSKFTIFDIDPLTKKQAIELVEKLEFWNMQTKKDFLVALKDKLYETHYQFASNPLLLTIMLMTYSSYGEIPGKIHVFYSKAYETMARLHDATKGSYIRTLHTKLTPEDFSKYFSKFCAATYKKEIYDFNEMTFNNYMNKVIKSIDGDHKKASPRDFLLDLIENLCIMYCEGEQYYFIHRSFQEYFAAVYFASDFDSNLTKVGCLFESNPRGDTDKTFDMLYDMIPKQVERFIFLPYLENLFTSRLPKGKDEYWEFLELFYPNFLYHEGAALKSQIYGTGSFLYSYIIEAKSLKEKFNADNCKWTEEIYSLPDKEEWVNAYDLFTREYAYDVYDDPSLISKKSLRSKSIISIEGLPEKYFEYFGQPEIVGRRIVICIRKLRRDKQQFPRTISYMESDDFPLFREYQAVKKYYEHLKEQTQIEIESDDLFDDL